MYYKVISEVRQKNGSFLQESQVILVEEGKTVSDYGVAEDSIVEELPNYQLDSLKTEKINQDKNKRRTLESQGVLVQGKGTIDTDTVSQQRINSAVMAAFMAKTLKEPFNTVWTMKNNNKVPFNAEEMLTMSKALNTHIAHLHTKYEELRTIINEATVEELDNIDVESFPWSE